MAGETPSGVPVGAVLDTSDAGSPSSCDLAPLEMLSMFQSRSHRAHSRATELLRARD